MATLSAVRFLLVTVLLVAVLPSSLASGSSYKPVCYTKIQKCCFNFAACGTITKKVYKTVDCSFKKCYKVCKPRCYYKTKRVPYKSCVKVWKRKYVCKRVKVYHDYKYVWKNVCKPKYVHKKVCVRKYRYVKRKICKKRCHRVCKKIAATCIKIHVLSYPKYCPTLKCYKFSFKGSTKEPSVIIGAKSKLVKVIDGKRTITH